jgi:hypothetical protein
MIPKQQRFENLSLLAFQAKMYYSVKRGAPLLYDCNVGGQVPRRVPPASRVTGSYIAAADNIYAARQDSPPCTLASLLAFKSFW